MNNINKYFAVIIFALVAVGFFYSCSKDSDHNNSQSKDVVLETRVSNSACSPESVYPIFTGCTHQQRSILISFTSGLKLYSNGSTLYQLCPDVQFNVTYTFSKCILADNGEVHFVHNLNYNIADIIAACPALQTAINNQIALGNLVGFLDLLDSDISKQIEFTEAYNAAVLNQFKYLCQPSGGEFYNIKYIQNSCYQWVPYIGGPEDRPIPAFRKEECNGSICCIRIGQYCVLNIFNGQPNLFGSGNSTYESTQGVCPVNCTHECGDPNSI